MNDHVLVGFYNNIEAKDISDNQELSIEEVLVTILRYLEIRPLCTNLFGLRDDHTLLWPHLSKQIKYLNPLHSYSLRIRYKIQTLKKLNELDPKSFEYYYYQVRSDFLNGELFNNTQDANHGLGLVVTDLVHHLQLNPGLKLKDLDIKHFMPKSLNSFIFRINVKKTTDKLLENNAERYESRGPSFFRELYLEKVEEIGNVQHLEKYDVEIIEGTIVTKAEIIVDPYDEESPGIFYINKKKKHVHICQIEQLVFISIRKDEFTVELSHEAGVPTYIKLQNLECLESFIGSLNGHYHLMKIWTYDLCKDLPTPSLVYLKSNRCHGPVGKSFAVNKLKTKGNGESGVGLLRASSYEYDVFGLTIFNKDSEEQVHARVLHTNSKFHFEGSDIQEDSLLALIKKTIKDNIGNLGLKRLLPPSDLDVPEQLLICAVKQHTQPVLTQSEPNILSLDQFHVEDDTPIKGQFGNVYYATKTSTGERVVVKVPSLLSHEKLGFLEMLGSFLLVKGDSIVKRLGMTFSPVTIVMECFSNGPLDQYLASHAQQMRQVDLVEASTYLAKALWDLQKAGFTHGNIRCHNIFVAEHSDTTFKVKLSDPGKIEYSLKDIHWIPREHIDHPASALTDPYVDAWAFATTLWQIFSLGVKPLAGSDLVEVRALYRQGNILPKPFLCPKDVYQIMHDCWHADKYARKRPQVIMRDINHIFYYMYNSRRSNEYSQIDVAPSVDSPDGDLGSISTDVTRLTIGSASLVKICSEDTQHLSVPSTEFSVADVDSTYFPSPDTTKGITIKDLLRPFTLPIQSVDFSMPTESLELHNSNIKIIQRIGSGNYGYVFRGEMCHEDGTVEEVALKRLISLGNTEDFKKETRIMKSLRHENIVLLYGLIGSSEEGDSHRYMVMEYLPLGSLQDYVRAKKTDLSLTSDKKLLAFALDIAKGMDYLESKKIIHRDLAARNVLVASEDHVKITDFGLAQQPNQGNYYIMRTVRELPIRWFALESIEYRRYSHKSDVWSYGVTCWEAFTRGLSPDLPIDAVLLIQTLKNGTRLTCRPPCHHLIYSKLILPCWDEDPHRRPDFTKLISTIFELQEEFD